MRRPLFLTAIQVILPAAACSAQQPGADTIRRWGAVTDGLQLSVSNHRMKILLALFSLSTLAASCLAQNIPQQRECRYLPCVAATARERDIFETITVSPTQELRSGTATLSQATAWVIQENNYMFAGLRSDPDSLELAKQDIDLDGTADLLIDTERGGSGGVVYAAFLTTPRGLLYIGTFLGRIRALPVESGQRKRVVISSRIGGGKMRVELAELHPNGLHRVASTMLTTTVTGTDEGTRLLEELMRATTVSSEALTQVFGGYNFQSTSSAVQRTITLSGDSARTLMSLLGSGNAEVLTNIESLRRLVVRDLVVLKQATHKSELSDPKFELHLFMAWGKIGNGQENAAIGEAASPIFLAAAKVPGGVSMQGGDYSVDQVACSIDVRLAVASPQRFQCTITLPR